MTTQTIDVQKNKEERVDTVERTRARKTFVPPVDIFENTEAIILTADMPGVDESNIDITLEKNVLTITGNVEVESPEGYEMIYREYESGDYQRSFTLGDEIDRDKIEASVRDGVLRLILPKAEKAVARKIKVNVG